MSFGATVNQNYQATSYADTMTMRGIQASGKVYFVDSANGSASNSGLLGWADALATITAAAALAVAGDTILISGSFTEAVSIAVAGVRIIGVGTGPNMATWTGAADAKCLTLTAANCLVENIRFRPPAYTAGVPAAIYLSTGSTYTVIRGCRFQGKADSWYGIYTLGDCDNSTVEDCEFCYMNTATYGTAIKSTGASETTGFTIRRCKFRSNLNHIVFPMKEGTIVGNLLAAGGLAAAGTYSATLTVLGIDVHGLASTVGYNQIHENQLGSLYHQACYYGATGDDWNHNFVTDRTHGTQVDATTGLSILAPAA